ncbi:MAG TPA: sigma-70 family RNA polymerase sigma factor, partial [Patescibacteria group bacterium]|nr:sigma-70 family RNA polymerase sigma factor [Patescibacteria group bacterium]
MEKILLEPSGVADPVSERLLRAAARLEQTPGSDLAKLFPKQLAVFQDFANFLMDLATQTAEDVLTSFARIILPPRTGKTVLAAHIIKATGLCTAFVTNTKALVVQASDEIASWNPGIPIGRFYSEEKSLVRHGINITTYSMLQGYWKKHGELPPEIRSAAIVFVDEGHHCMTQRRLLVLRNGFDPLAVRIALTATPNYDWEQKMLARYFPELIHEITMAEAVELDMLAPLRFWLYEVDTDASRVKMRQNDFDPDMIGELMSEAPFFQDALKHRYEPQNRNIPTYIRCASRQQAYDLWKYFKEHRPPGTPEPGLVISGRRLGDPPQKTIEKFKHQEIDTIISVRILGEGWDAPHCKLEINLAPSISPVLSLQTFLRVMTRVGDQEARIIMLVPKNLPTMPITPTEFIENYPSSEYQAGDLIGSPKQREKAKLKPIHRYQHTPVKKVKLVSRLLLASVMKKSNLNPKDPDQVRRVLETNPEFHPDALGLGYRRFRWLMFNHPLFFGRGEQLLRLSGVRPGSEAFYLWIAWLYPDVAATNWLARPQKIGGVWVRPARMVVKDIPCEEDVARLQESPKPSEKQLGVTKAARAAFEEGWAAISGGLPFESAVDYLTKKELKKIIRELLDELTVREQDVIQRRFGFHEEEQTHQQVAEAYEVTRERIREIESKALRKLRQPWRSKHLSP